ncbi:hypothetical protein BD560DRAFT_407196 [Blakeslea trispora]|nr:hypothetical protein BD560DRAFT_407196 [Blakeslea trispora]
MYSTWHNLPTELLLNVFDDLIGRDITNCLCVCPQWQRAALMKRYKIVSISCRTQLEKFVNTISTASSSPGQFVSGLHIAPDLKQELENPSYSEDGEPLDLFSRIIKYAPRLEALTVSHPSSLFWERMAKETSQGNLLLLNFLQHPIREKDHDNYHKTVMNLTNTMEDIAIYDTKLFDQDNFKVLFDKLPEFKRLRLLTVKWIGRIPYVKLNDTLDALSILQFLTIELDTEEERLSTFVEYGRFPIKQHQMLRQLNITALLDSDNAYLYIMEKFSNLVALTVSAFDNIVYYPAPPAFSDDTIEQFANYITKLNEFNFKNIQITNIFDLMDRVLSQVKDPDMAVELLLYRPQKVFEAVYIEIRHQQNRQASVINFGIDNATYRMFLERLGSRLRFLNIDCSTEEQVFFTDEGHLYDEMSYVNISFSDIIATCTQAKTMSINDGILSDLNLDGPQNSSITSMVIKTCECTDEFLKSLSSRLPLLNTIEFKHTILCYNSDNMANAYSSQAMRFDMPLTDFKVFTIKDSNLLEVMDILYLKTITPSGDKCYRLSEREAVLMTSKEYDSAQNIDNPVLSIEIACNSIQKIKFYDSTRGIQISYDLRLI